MRERTNRNQVFSQSKSQVRKAWLFAFFWNILIWYAIIMGGENILKAFNENPFFYFFVTFPFIGFGLIIYAAKETKAWHKFGKTPVILQPFPGQIGGRFSGYLRLSIAKTEAAPAVFCLNCVRRYYSTDNGKEKTQQEDIIWQDRASFVPNTSGKESQINFLFKTPLGLPATEAESDNYHYWQLHVYMDLKGINYDRIFNVPMETTSEQERTFTERFEVKVSDRVAHENTNVSQVPKVEHTATGLSLYYGYGRAIGMAVAIFMFGSFFAMFGYFFFDGFLTFLPATMGIIAGFVGLISFIFCFLGLLLLANNLAVEVSLMGVRKKQRFFGFLFEEFTDAKDIVDISVKQNSSAGNGKSRRVWYCLKLMTVDGQEMEVGDSLEGQSYAEEIKQKMIDALGHNWKPATLSPQQEETKKPLPLWLKKSGKLLPYFFVIAFLYDLNFNIPFIYEFVSAIISEMDF